MTGKDAAEIRARTERWFDDRGLPYFVDRRHDTVMAAVSRIRLVLVLLAVISAAVGVLVGIVVTDVSLGVWMGTLVFVLGALAYALRALHFGPIFSWAVRYTFSSLRLLFPLVVRALPVLMLFITFLFINNEVWQVCSNLSRTLLWSTVLFFAVIAVVFLLVRLPEEVRKVIAEAQPDSIVSDCESTPVAAIARRLPGNMGMPRLSALRRANLVLIMLVSQAIQVLLLALIVFSFFVVLGHLVITRPTVEAWIGHPPHDLPRLHWLPVSNELFQVSVFLSAFTGLYFTVYAVTDPVYRSNFFDAIANDLRRALAVAAVYQLTLTDSET
jgi:hypothetical protein